MTVRRTLLATVVLTAALTGCSQDPFEAYCEVVTEQQTPMTEALAGGGPTALLKALPIFETLEEKAPDDIRDDWKVVTSTLGGLQEALDDAGVDPATYDKDNPPDDLSEAEKDRIDVAAARLTEPDSAAAFANVEQQARDVCKTPLHF